MSGNRQDKPSAGNGKVSKTAKPKAADCAQRLASGTKLIKQPSKGWGLGSLFVGRKRKV